MMKSELDSELFNKLALETSKIAWHELQKFFAQGIVLYVQSEEDLVSTAVQVANDNKEEVSQLKERDSLVQVTDEQAKHWYASDSFLWCVVVAPFVLVQEVDED